MREILYTTIEVYTETTESTGKRGPDNFCVRDVSSRQKKVHK